MTELQSHSILLNRSFDDFDELATEAKYWDLEFKQLDRGPFAGRVLQAVAGNMLFSEARFQRVLDQKGTAPPGLMTIAIPARSAVKFHWRKKTITGDDIFLFPRSGELNSTSQSDFHVYIVSLPETVLQSAFDEARADLNALRRDEKITVGHAGISRLRTHLHQLASSISEQPHLLDNCHVAEQLCDEIPRLFAEAAGQGNQSQHSRTARRRDRCVHMATAFIAARADEPLTVTQVCDAAEVSERTLQYAFLEHLGVSPKAYLLAVRLNGARRDLRRAVYGTAVSEVASRWGFWHMSQFAVAYRRHFGELPSETLKASVAQNYE